MLKILYDISILGRGYYNSQLRTGIFRVVENVALSLIQSGECELSFCAVNSVTEVMASINYISTKKEFATIPFRFRGNKKALDFATWLHPEPGEGVICNTWLKTLRFAAKRSGVLFPGIDAEMARDVDIYHSTFAPLPAPEAMPPRVKRIITLYDIIPILHPEFFWDRKNNVLHKVVQSIKPGDYVLAISQTTKNDLCQYADIDPDNVFVVPLAASNSFYRCTDMEALRKVREKYRIPNAPYVLSLSTLEPRKNIAQTVRCFTRLVEEQGISDLHLVLVGAKGWDNKSIFDELKASASVRNRIILPGYVADEDLAAIYSGALMFVYPSFYEGFGLPPLEAMQCGVPVITSNTSSLPEVVGDAGIMVHPTDTDALCQAMSILYTDTAVRNDYSRKALVRAKNFSWNNCATLTIGAYHTAVSR
jgi:glycosyltransferase involved in cell wall biosynthesis